MVLVAPGCSALPVVKSGTPSSPNFSNVKSAARCSPRRPASTRLSVCSTRPVLEPEDGVMGPFSVRSALGWREGSVAVASR